MSKDVEREKEVADKGSGRVPRLLTERKDHELETDGEGSEHG